LVLLFSGNGRSCCWLLGRNIFNYTPKWLVVSPSLCFIKTLIYFLINQLCYEWFPIHYFCNITWFLKIQLILWDMIIWIQDYFKHCSLLLVKASLIGTHYGYVISKTIWTSCSHFGFRPTWHYSIYVLSLTLWNIYGIHL